MSDTTWTIQPTDHVDHITEDGTELTRRPYPYHVDMDGKIGRQDFWRGRPWKAIGVVPSADSQDLTFWADLIKDDPQALVNKYLVVTDNVGQWSTVVTAIAEVTVNER